MPLLLREYSCASRFAISTGLVMSSCLSFCKAMVRFNELFRSALIYSILRKMMFVMLLLIDSC